MAQTKRRRTKHRGNAAGVVEVRGRTGRKPTASEKRGAGPTSKADAARDKRLAKLNQPPTWRGAFNRALIATAIMLAVWLVVIRPKNAIAFLALAPVVLLIYTPMGYYTDLFMFRRRQRKQAAVSR